eukprot:180624-Lingulodinium_polyedra.AAC.1
MRLFGPALIDSAGTLRGSASEVGCRYRRAALASRSDLPLAAAQWRGLPVHCTCAPCEGRRRASTLARGG